MKDKGPHTFTENQEIEVYSKANEQEAFGWWKAVIKVLSLLCLPNNSLDAVCML